MKKIIIFITIIVVLVIGFLGYKYLNNKKQESNNISDLSLSKVKERGKLIVGTGLSFKPMEYFDINHKIIGFDIDLINKIASTMGVSVEIVNVSWVDLFTGLKEDKYDVVIDSVTITPERQKEMLFSIPYLNAGQVVLVRKDNEDVKKLEDLKNIKTGVLKNSTCEEAAKLYVNPLLIERYNKQDIVVQHLKDKEVDAIIVDYVVAYDITKNDSNLKMVMKPFTEEYYGIVTKLDNVSLMDEINRILKELKKNGQITEINNKWLK